MKHFLRKVLWGVAIACLTFPFYAVPLNWARIWIFPLPPGDDGGREFFAAIMFFMLLGILLLGISAVISMFCNRPNKKAPSDSDDTRTLK